MSAVAHHPETDLSRAMKRRRRHARRLRVLAVVVAGLVLAGGLQLLLGR